MAGPPEHFVVFGRKIPSTPNSGTGFKTVHTLVRYLLTRATTLSPRTLDVYRTALGQ